VERGSARSASNLRIRWPRGRGPGSSGSRSSRSNPGSSGSIVSRADVGAVFDVAGRPAGDPAAGGLHRRASTAGGEYLTEGPSRYSKEAPHMQRFEATQQATRATLASAVSPR
jgi:hypothetical protein